MKTTPLPSVIEVFQNNVPDWRKTEINYPLHTHLLTQDRNQTYTRLVEGIEVALKRRFVTQPQEYKDSDANVWREGYNRALTDILENVVKPLYGKE